MKNLVSEIPIIGGGTYSPAIELNRLRASNEHKTESDHLMSDALHPEVHGLIREVEELSGRMVHVTEDPDLKVMATITTARQGAPAHFLRYRPGTRAIDYLVAYQLLFLVRMFSCPVGERWEVVATAAEQLAGVEAMGLTGYPPDFARSMVANITTQLRTYSVGARVDSWIRKWLPDLRGQQDTAIRSQILENEQALSPEIRGKFPKALVDTNTAMNAAFAVSWGKVFGEPRFAIPFKALGFTERADQLLACSKEVCDDPSADRQLITSWAGILGMDGTFHFEPHSLT